FQFHRAPGQLWTEEFETSARMLPAEDPAKQCRLGPHLIAAMVLADQCSVGTG
ncbi:unnamed protein product, partial [Symbiodinium pilosum]